MEQLFAFDPSRWHIHFLFFIPALINFSLFLYVIFFLPQNRINFTFSIFVLFVGFWQMTEGCMRLSTTAETAELWYGIMGVIAVFITPLGMQFSLSFHNLHKKVPYAVIVFTQFLPATMFSILLLGGIGDYQIVRSEHWYWVFNPIPSMFTNIIYSWISLNGFVILGVLVIQFMRSEKGSFGKKQSFLLALGFVFPLIGGVVGEVILPLIFNFDVTPLTTPLFTVFSITSLIAMLRYRMLDYSPKHHWEHIVKSINEGIFILNNENKIMYANRNFCETLSYKPGELFQKDYSLLFGSSGDELMDSLKENAEQPQSEYLMRASDGKYIWMMMSCAPYTDSKGNVIGSICICTNIDRLKKAEKVIEDERNKLKMAIEGGKMLTYDLDFINNEINYSNNAESLFGLDKNIRSIKEAIAENVHKDDRHKLLRSLHNLKENGIVEDLQFRFVRPGSDKVQYIERRGELVYDINGKITGFRGILLDITGLKEAEIKSQRNEERLKAIFENEPECVMVLDRSGKLSDINPSGLRMLNMTDPENLAGICITELIFEEDRKAFTDMHKKVLNGNSASADFRLLFAGSLRWLETNAVPLRNEMGEVVSVLTVSRDITDFKAKTDEIISINSKLERSEQRLIEAQEMAHIGNWEIDFFTGKSTWSGEASRIFGVNPEIESEGITNWFSYVHPDDRNAVAEAVEKSMSDFSHFSLEHRVKRHDNSIRYVYTEGRYEFDSKGDARGMVGVIHDITERKQYEINLQNLLQITNDQNKRLQDFAYIVSHKIRSHSANISGIISLMSEEGHSEEFGMLKKSADRLAETIETVNEIITFQRANS